MANPQTEKGFTRIAKKIIDEAAEEAIKQTKKKFHL
jgi:phosphoribosyl-ATP pyrophosphohydrolase